MFYVNVIYSQHQVSFLKDNLHLKFPQMKTSTRIHSHFHLKVLGFSEKFVKKFMQSFFFKFKLEFILMDIRTLRLNLTSMIRTKYDY